MPRASSRRDPQVLLLPRPEEDPAIPDVLERHPALCRTGLAVHVEPTLTGESTGRVLRLAEAGLDRELSQGHARLERGLRVLALGNGGALATDSAVAAAE